MESKKHTYKILSETLIKKFAKRNIDAVYCDNIDEAREKVLSMIPEGSSVSFGGSKTVKYSGVLEALKEGNYDLIDRETAKTKEEMREVYAKSVMSDFYLMSTNAFTVDGELVNIDGNGNRVACMIQGPEHVIILTGMNKMAANVEDAIRRVHTMAAPPNCVRLGVKTPCAATGVCGNCLAPNTICCHTVITRSSRHPGRIIIVLVGEELGY